LSSPESDKNTSKPFDLANKAAPTPLSPPPKMLINAIRALKFSEIKFNYKLENVPHSINSKCASKGIFLTKKRPTVSGGSFLWNRGVLNQRNTFER
jgi:hypothetical protein